MATTNHHSHLVQERGAGIIRLPFGSSPSPCRCRCWPCMEGPQHPPIISPPGWPPGI